MKPSFRIGLLLAALVIFADRISKDWALAFVTQHGGYFEVTPFFNLVAVYNYGISFGLFQSGDTGRWILIALALAISAGLFVWMWREDSKWVTPALGAIIGGALGNVFDRMVDKKAVFDFLDFHAFGYHWPAFNVADSAIVLGVAIILIDSFIHREENVNGEDTATRTGSKPTDNGDKSQ